MNRCGQPLNETCSKVCRTLIRGRPPRSRTFSSTFAAAVCLANANVLAHCRRQTQHHIPRWRSLCGKRPSDASDIYMSRLCFRVAATPPASPERAVRRQVVRSGPANPLPRSIAPGLVESLGTSTTRSGAGWDPSRCWPLDRAGSFAGVYHVRACAFDSPVCIRHQRGDRLWIVNDESLNAHPYRQPCPPPSHAHSSPPKSRAEARPPSGLAGPWGLLVLPLLRYIDDGRTKSITVRK